MNVRNMKEMNMVEFIELKNITDYEEEAFRNSYLLDQIYIQAKNISALKRGVPPIIYRMRNKQLETLYSFKKYLMFKKAGDEDSAYVCLSEAEDALSEAKRADKDLQQAIKRKGYEYNRISLQLESKE